MDKTQWDKIKQPVCTTLPVRVKGMFYILAYKRFGYAKYSIQKAMVKALEEFNKNELAKYTKEERERIYEEVKDYLLADEKIKHRIAQQEKKTRRITRK